MITDQNNISVIRVKKSTMFSKLTYSPADETLYYTLELKMSRYFIP